MGIVWPVVGRLASAGVEVDELLERLSECADEFDRIGVSPAEAGHYSAVLGAI